MDKLFTIYIAIIAIAFAFAWLMIIKNEITYRNHRIISNAILNYQMAMIKARIYDYYVDYSDMEEYETTWRRLWDWGYKNILPKEKYEIIKDYIEKERG